MPAKIDPQFDSAKKPVRVLLVDDSPRVLQDLHHLLELTGQIKIVGEARDGAEAVRLSAELAPQVVVMDLEMPGMDGYSATRQIKSRQLARRVVILSVHAEPEIREASLAAGADIFVLKGAGYEILMDAILAGEKPPE